MGCQLCSPGHPGVGCGPGKDGYVMPVIDPPLPKPHPRVSRTSVRYLKAEAESDRKTTQSVLVFGIVVVALAVAIGGFQAGTRREFDTSPTPQQEFDPLLA